MNTLYINKGLIGEFWEIASCRKWILQVRETRRAIEEYGQAAVTAASKEREEAWLQALGEIRVTIMERPLKDFITRKQFRVIWHPKFNS